MKPKAKILVVDRDLERGRQTVQRLAPFGYICQVVNRLDVHRHPFDVLFWETERADVERLQTAMKEGLAGRPMVISTPSLGVSKTSHAEVILRPWLSSQAVEAIEKVRLRGDPQPVLISTTSRPITSPRVVTSGAAASPTALWAEVIQDPNDERVHECFLQACVETQSLGFALRHYQQLVKDHAEAEVPKRYLERVGVIIGFYALRPQGHNLDRSGLARGPRLFLLVFILASILLVSIASASSCGTV